MTMMVSLYSKMGLTNWQSTHATHTFNGHYSKPECDVAMASCTTCLAPY